MPEIKLTPPNDLLSVSIYTILSYRKDEEFYNLVKGWNKTITIDVKELYPITMIFMGDEVRLVPNSSKKSDLKILMSIHTLMDVAYGRKSMVTAFLSRKIKIKGILKIKTLLRFIKIVVKSMKMVAEDPNLNYFEVEKVTK